MNSNSEWDRAQAEYFVRMGELHRSKGKPCRYAPVQSAMPEGEVVPVDGDNASFPDYEAESQERITTAS